MCTYILYYNHFKGTEQRKVKMMRSQDVPKTLTQHRARVSKGTKVAEIGLRPAGADRDSQKRKELKEIAKLTPIKAIRQKCLDCCCGQLAEVRMCTCTTCALYGYRMGHRPKDEQFTIETDTGEKSSRSL